MKLGSQLADFREILHLNIFQMSVEKIQFSSKSDKNNGHATRKPMHIYGNISLTLLRMRKIQIEVVRKIKTHFYFQ
jgi:transposase-like protein